MVDMGYSSGGRAIARKARISVGDFLGLYLLIIAAVAMVPSTRNVGTVLIAVGSLMAGFQSRRHPQIMGYLLAITAVLSSVPPPYLIGILSPQNAVVGGFTLGYALFLLTNDGGIVISWRVAPVLLMVMMGLSSVLWAPNQRHALSLALALAMAAMPYALSFTARVQREWVEGYAKGSVAAAVMSVLLGLALRYPETSGTRFTGVYNDPNFYAVYLCSVLPFALLWSGVKRWLRLIATGLLVLGVVLSVSRSGAALCVLLLGLVGLDQLRRGLKNGRTSVFLVPGLVVLALGLAWLLSHPTLLSQLGFGDLLVIWDMRVNGADISGLNGRLDVWEAALDVVSTHPVLGAGLGGLFAYTGWFGHNTWLELWAEVGPFGLVILASLVITAVKGALLVAWSKTSVATPIALSVVTVFVASFTLSMEYSEVLWNAMAVAVWAVQLHGTGRMQQPAT